MRTCAGVCGRPRHAIDRQLIIRVLNNEACTLQLLEDHPRALSYVEAIIYQVRSYLEEPTVTELAAELQQISTQKVNELCHTKGEEIGVLLTRQEELGVYLMRYLGLQALTGDYESAVSTGREALTAMKQLFRYCRTL